jgi:hypothetical protein
MPRISRYANDQSISDNDKLLGSDEAGNTKNFKVSDLSNFFGTFNNYEILGDIRYVNENQLTINFHTAQRGFAFVG